jgi:hypothetical protein
MIISSQHTLNEKTVNEYIERIENGETFTGSICTIESEECSEYGITALLIDGHHRLAAYEALEMKIEFVESEIDLQNELNKYGLDALLENHWNDGDWYNIETGISVW